MNGSMYASIKSPTYVKAWATALQRHSKSCVCIWTCVCVSVEEKKTEAQRKTQSCLWGDLISSLGIPQKHMHYIVVHDTDISILVREFRNTRVESHEPLKTDFRHNPFILRQFSFLHTPQGSFECLSTNVGEELYCQAMLFRNQLLVFSLLHWAIQRDIKSFMETSCSYSIY